MSPPKTDASTLKTVYLRTLNNKISDKVFVETSDFCPVSMKLSYRVNFEGDPNAWFNVDNYVKFFTDPYYTTILWTTVRIAVLVTAVCLVLAFPLAYVVARTQSRFKNLLIISIVLPLFVGNSVRAAGWTTRRRTWWCSPVASR